MFFDALWLVAATGLTLLWAYLAWRRIRYLARYLQLEGYSSSRYLTWLVHQRREIIFLVWNIVSISVLVVFLTSWADSEVGAEGILFLVVVGYILAFVHIGILPRNRDIKQRFTPTSRALRLLAVAGIVAPVLALFVVEITLSLILTTLSPYRYRDLGSVLFTLHMYWLLLGGPIAVLVAPFSLPVANILLWPVEEAFRRYYLHLARRNLVRSGATVIAITGSYGKTSTKHYLNHILAGRYRVLMTPKSYNTLLGISRVINDILSKDVSYDYFIVEAGAYIPGEIAQICKLVRPQISMVITVGPMHLERFGSIENVVRAKYEIIESLPSDGVGVFNADDERVRGMAERGYPPDPKHRILVTRQGAPGARLAATNVRMTAEGLDFDVRDNQTNEERSMHTPLYGEHNVTNILMAIAVARHLGMSLAEIAMRVATLEAAEHRLNRVVMPDGTILIDDAYSANPVGTRTALDVLALHNSGARRVVVSSGMFELGPLHEEENRKLGEQLAEVASDVILIGKVQTEPIQAGLQEKRFPADHLHIVDTLNEAVQIYKSLLRPGDALLILTDLPDTYA